MPEPLRAVLFDLDGTLVRTFIDFRAMRNAVCDVFAAKYPHIKEAQALTETDTLVLISQLLALLPQGEHEQTHHELIAVVVDHERIGCAHPEAISGATELLTELARRGVRVGIVTRNTRAIAETLCETMHLSHDLLLAREDTAAFKPDPKPLLVACERFSVSPKDAAMVGDLWADVEAGRRAGCIFTIGIQWGHDPPNRFAKSVPTHTVSTFANVSKLLLDATIEMEN